MYDTIIIIYFDIHYHHIIFYIGAYDDIVIILLMIIWSAHVRCVVGTYHYGYNNTVKHCSRFPSSENLCTTRVAFVLCGTCCCVRPGLTVRTRCSVHADDARAHSTQAESVPNVIHYRCNFFSSCTIFCGNLRVFFDIFTPECVVFIYKKKIYCFKM